jgi:hypothetical protein
VTPDRLDCQRQPTARDPPPTTDQPRSAACARRRADAPARARAAPRAEASSPLRIVGVEIPVARAVATIPPRPVTRASLGCPRHRWRSSHSPANALNFSPIAASSATRSWFYEREPPSRKVIYLRAQLALGVPTMRPPGPAACLPHRMEQERLAVPRSPSTAGDTRDAW